MNKKLTSIIILILALSCFLPLTTAETAPILNDGLVLYFPFDEVVGNTCVDKSGNNNNGIANHVALQAGKYGNAMIFNGSRFVNVSDSSTLRGMTALTVSLWAYSYSYTPTYSSFFSRWATGPQRYFIGGYFDATNLSWFVSDGTNTKNIATPLPSTMAWHQYTFIFNGSDHLYIYLDGVQVKNDTTTIPNISNDANNGVDQILKIGKYSSYYYMGLIDDFRIYNRALTESEITNLYENPTTPTPTPTEIPTATLSPNDDMPLSTMFTVGLLAFLIVLNIVLLGLGSMIVRFLVALFTLVMAGIAITVSDVPLAPYFQMFTVVISLLCMFLAAKAKG